MTWTTEIRQKARQKRRDLGLAPEQLAPAAQVLAALDTHTGIACWPVPTGDPLLCGAQAVLNLPADAIFQDSSRPEPARRFDAAHEYAHVFLHGGSCHCAVEDLSSDSLTEPAAVGAARVEGYSPRQRRECEANAYAAELLLPDALLRRLFFDECWSADAIADAVGLSPSLVLAQMTEVLLLPPLIDAPAMSAPPAAQAVTLDPFQCAAAEFPAGPLLLGAGPGTGKTKTLVGRCQFLVGQNVPAEKILCLTFSRDAAQEMQERLSQAGVGAVGAGPWVGTFHAFGLDILRRYGDRLGLTADVQLLGTLDAVTLLENNLSRLELDTLDNLYNPSMHLKGILRQISRAKDELCLPERYAQMCEAMHTQAALAEAEFAARTGKKLKKDQEVVDKAVLQASKAGEIARCYRVYEELKAEHGYLDFGDLIARSVQLLETCPDVCAALQAEFPQVLADEYQDVNRACARLLRLVAGADAAGLWAVGDHRQSIYRFRGASPANVSAFKSDYPNGQRLELGINYRSLQPIVGCFGSVAAALTPETERGDFQVWQAQRGQPGISAVTVAEAPDEEGQADGIAKFIQEMQPVYSYAQQAILCRTHAQAQALADRLTLRDIPVLYLGKLMDRPEVKDLLCLLSLFSGDTGPELLRVGAMPEYAVPPEEARAFLARVRTAGISVFDALQDALLRQGMSEAAERGLTLLGQHLAGLKALNNDPASLLRHSLFNQSRFLHHLGADVSQPFFRLQKRLAVHQLYALTLAFDRRIVAPAAPAGPPNRTQEFLSHLRRQAAAGESPQGMAAEGAEGMDAVRILTAHKAKGLEYPVVFVPNLGHGQFPAQGRSDGLPEPSGLAAALADETDEEECLFFVALSRARDRLVLSRSLTSRTDRDIPPSPLLALLDLWLAGCDGAQTTWPSGRLETITEEGILPGSIELPTYSASALEIYERCPRQYYYEREMKLSGAFLVSGYPKFHGCVRQVLNWLEDEQAAGHAQEEDRVCAKLEEVWAASGPVGHLHEAKYKDSAVKMLKMAQDMMSGRVSQGRAWLTATLPSCRVTIRPDTLHRREDGSLVVARRLTGKPGDGDHRDKKLALLRRAMAETFSEENRVLELHYLADGQVIEIPLPATPYKAQQEAERLKKYEYAARGIRLRLFPAKPSASDECQTCPFALVCPQ